MLPQLTGLWRHLDFLKLWAGQTVSLFGWQITALALPLTAVLILQATLVMGACGLFIPFLRLLFFSGAQFTESD
jgi:hypothetical protein